MIHRYCTLAPHYEKTEIRLLLNKLKALLMETMERVSGHPCTFHSRKDAPWIQPLDALSHSFPVEIEKKVREKTNE